LAENNKLPDGLVDDILRSILVDAHGGDESQFSINEQGNYQLGLLKGHAIPVDRVKYIGRNARKRYREEQILRIQEEIDTLETEKNALQDNIEQTEKAITEAGIRLDAFPADADLQESFRQITNVRLKAKHHQEQMENLSAQIKEIYEEYTKVKWMIDE